MLELGNGVSCGVEDLAPPNRGEDQLGTAIGGVWTAFEVAEPLEVVDELGTGGETQPGPVGEGGEPDALDSHVPPDLQVREAQVRESLLPLREELEAEVVEQPSQELADRQPIGREFA